MRFAQHHDQDEETIHSVVQTDLVVVCDQLKLDDKGCNGSPDLKIEIISPSSASQEYVRKLRLYELAKVKEYWIVHPIDQIVTVYLLGDNQGIWKTRIVQCRR